MYGTARQRADGRSADPNSYRRSGASTLGRRPRPALPVTTPNRSRRCQMARSNGDSSAIQRRHVRSVIDNEYIRGLLWRERKDLSIALVCALLCTVSNLAAPVISGYFIEILAGRQPMELYPKLLAIMAVMYTLEPLLGRVYVFRAVRACERVLSTVRVEVFRVLLMQPIAFFDRHGPAELTNVLAVDLDTIRACIFGNISRDRGLRAVLEATGSIVVLAVLSWRLAPALATVIVSTGVAATLYRRRTRDIEAALASALRQLSAVAGQAFTNLRTVRSFAGENLERERFAELVESSFGSAVKFASAKAWLEAANRASIHASTLVLFGLGGWLVSMGHMPLRVVLTGIGFMYSLMYATQGTVNSFADVRKATSAFGRVRALLGSSRAEPQVEAAMIPGEWWLRIGSNGAAARHNQRRLRPGDPPPAMGVAALQPWVPAPGESQCPFPFRPMDDTVAAKYAATGDIVFSGVSFAYPSRADASVLTDVQLRLRRGSITALVGRSGAGKTTIAALISRFYVPDAGLITMGGIDIHAWSRRAWSDAVALVAQEPVLFAASVADNISYGRPRATRAEIVAAAEAANAHEFVEQLELGYDTLIGDRGHRLSGGQKQRVAIARALLKDAPVLILDEATSSLDSRSEGLVSEAIARLVRGRTVLVIAHRLSTIQRADRIAVISDGKVVEEGTCDELAAARGYYADLVNSQRLALNT